jgi:biopolymer transport protein ExbD
LRSLPPINPNPLPTPGNGINSGTLPQAPVTPGTNNSSAQN